MPELLILDEATSALDENSQMIVQDYIMNFKQMAKIVIAHRLSTIQKCDKIIRIENGSIKSVK